MPKFQGDFNQLKTLVAETGHKGNWDETENPRVFRSDDGAVLNWWPSTGTWNVQGQISAKSKLQDAISNSLARSSSTTEISTSTAVQELSDGDQIETLTADSASEDVERVFVVYGHDQAACEQLELLLHRLKLEPFVLGNFGGGGLTIIEALEAEILSRNSGNRFGIVLLTPDDMGYRQGDAPTDAEPRARQNVVMEMGMLLAAFGRERVAILKKGHVVEPTDISGIIYLPFNDHVRETAPKLCQRLSQAGFELDSGAIAQASS